MSRTEEKTGEAVGETPRERSGEPRSATGHGPREPEVDVYGDPSESGIRVAAQLGTAARATFRRAAAACSPEAKADENERALLIGSIARLIRDESTPETTRVAGLTLIGWLARRRIHEMPHTIGVDEARQAERRSRPPRAKAR